MNVDSTNDDDFFNETSFVNIINLHTLLKLHFSTEELKLPSG